MRTIALDGVSYPLPQCWSEIQPDQLPKLIRLVYMTPENGAMYHQLFQALLGIKPGAWKKIHRKHFGPAVATNVRQKNAEVLHDLLGMCRWVWQTPMTEQPFESLAVSGEGLWLLPEPNFPSMSYGELTDLYIHLNAYIDQTEAGEGEPPGGPVDYLVATACRPARPILELHQNNWDGDRREPYNEFIVRDRIKLLKTVPFEKKIMVLLYVASTIQALLGRYTLFDKPAAAGSAKPNSTTARRPGETYIGQGFIKNSHLLAEKGIFGTLRQTQQANAHEVLLFLEEYRADQRQREHEQQ